MSTPELSIVLPCYNESAGLAEILKRFDALGDGTEFELILVDNGSRDDTQAVLQNLLPSYPFARSVHVRENRGYGHGISQGLAAARGVQPGWRVVSANGSSNLQHRSWCRLKAPLHLQFEGP